MEGFRRKGDFTPLIIGPLFAKLFSIGFIITTNNVFDPSPPEVFRPSIIKKFRRTGGKSSSNHFRVAPWNPVTGVSSVMVHYRVYDRKSPGDTVTIYLRQGIYGIPTYDVEKPMAP